MTGIAQTGFVTDTSGHTWMLGSGSMGGYMGSTVTYGIATDSGTEAGVKLTRQPQTKDISASLYIKFVKSKLGKIQQDKVKRRLAKLQKLVAYSEEMKQQALYEELTKEVAVLVREAEIAAYGIDTFIDKAHIDKFMHLVKERCIKWDLLEKFPRVVPKKVQTKVKALHKANIFDELWILYIDYTKTEPLKTNKEKIRNKDPILFGRFKYQPDRYYFIADWVDEYCDLTLDKMVTKIKTDDKEFELDTIEDISKERWDNIVKEVADRQKRLDAARSGNFHDHMAEEIALKKEREKIAAEEAAKKVIIKDKETGQEIASGKLVKHTKRPWWKVWA